MHNAIVTHRYGFGSYLAEARTWGTIVISGDLSLSIEDNHRAAARALEQREGLNPHSIMAMLPDGTFCHVLPVKGVNK